MREERLSCASLTLKLPQYRGKKSVKIELFPAKQWSFVLRPGQGRGCGNVSPPLPCRGQDRAEYYSERFRVQVNGKWFKKKRKQYVFLTLPEVMGLAEGELKDMVMV